MDSHVENLNHRLRGLCDNVDAGQEKFQEKEMVFSIRGTSTVPLTLRVRHSIDPNSRIPWQLRWASFYIWAKVELKPDQICGSTWDESEEHSCEKLLWYRLQQQCRWVSHWTRMQVVNKCPLWRGCVKHSIHFRLEYEYIAKGYIFRKGRIKVTVSRVCVKLWFVTWLFPSLQIYKIGNNPSNMDNLEPVTGSWLVCASLFHLVIM